MWYKLLPHRMEHILSLRAHSDMRCLELDVIYSFFTFFFSFSHSLLPLPSLSLSLFLFLSWSCSEVELKCLYVCFVLPCHHQVTSHKLSQHGRKCSCSCSLASGSFPACLALRLPWQWLGAHSTHGLVVMGPLSLHHRLQNVSKWLH